MSGNYDYPPSSQRASHGDTSGDRYQRPSPTRTHHAARTQPFPMPLSENPAMTVPLIDGDKLDSFDPSKTVRYQLGHASTSNRITELERLLELGVHPRNEENIRVALQAYRHGELPRTDTTYVFIQFGVIIPHNQIEKINPGQPFWGEGYLNQFLGGRFAHSTRLGGHELRNQASDPSSNDRRLSSFSDNYAE